jgi:hypothetical protein
MFALRTAAVALLLTAGLSVASDSPFFRLRETKKNGKVEVLGTNVCHSPIVAYVVIFERANQRTVWEGVYKKGDNLETGKTVRVGALPDGSYMGRPTITVDYVRLANGTSWGDAQTDEAKEIVAQFRK